MDLSRVYSFKPCMFVCPNFFNMKNTYFYYYVWKNNCLNYFLNVFGCCVFIFLPLLFVFLPSVKRRRAKVLSLCEFRYSCCDSCCRLNLETPSSKNTNLVWQSLITLGPTSLVKQVPFATHNHSLMMIPEMCIEVVFRNSNWIRNFLSSLIYERNASRNYDALSLASNKPHRSDLISHVL